jgi:hypothetical protein
MIGTELSTNLSSRRTIKHRQSFLNIGARSSVFGLHSRGFLSGTTSHQRIEVRAAASSVYLLVLHSYAHLAWRMVIPLLSDSNEHRPFHRFLTPLHIFLLGRFPTPCAYQSSTTFFSPLENSPVAYCLPQHVLGIPAESLLLLTRSDFWVDDLL